MGFDWIDILKTFALPVVTGFLGWIYSKYRNKQEREKDILDNVQRIIDLQDAQIKKQDDALHKANNVNQRLEAKLDRKNKSVRQANKCPFTTEGDGCPVLAQEEKNEHCYDLDCARCEHHNPKCDD